MSTNYYGLAVPLALRRFRIAPFARNLYGQKVSLPRDLAPGINILHLNYRRKHRKVFGEWEPGHEWVKELHLSGAKREYMVTNMSEDGREEEVELPSDQQVETYNLWVYPRYRQPFAWFTRARNFLWAYINDIDPAKCFSVYLKRGEFFEELGLHEDGRPYIMLLRNSGKILYCSHEISFHYRTEARGMSKVSNEEWKRYEKRLMLAAGENKEPVRDASSLLSEGARQRSKASEDFIRALLQENADKSSMGASGSGGQGESTRASDSPAFGGSGGNDEQRQSQEGRKMGASM